MSRPVNVELHTRIAVARSENPGLGLVALAKLVGCSPHTVRSVAPQASRRLSPTGRGVRVMIPRDLHNWADERGGVVALLAGLRAGRLV